MNRRTDRLTTKQKEARDATLNTAPMEGRPHNKPKQ